jgi:hypothetical protein
MFKEKEKIEHEEILKGFKYLKKAREVFDQYSKTPKYFSGNDNHIGDIGEYWTFRYYSALGQKPELSGTKNATYDIKLNISGKYISVKTMSEWNKNNQGGQLKGIDKSNIEILIFVKLNKEFMVDKFCIVPKRDLLDRGKTEKTRWKWWPWLDAERYDKTKDFNKKIVSLKLNNE